MNVLSGYKTWKHFLRGMKMTALLLFLCVGSASPSGRYSDGVLTPRAEESCDANGRESVDQHRRIRGKVVDSSGDPVIGANVLEKGTANGTVTDVEGNFVLTVSDHPTLVVSYIGYTTVEIRLGDRQIVNIVLKEDAEALDLSLIHI